MTYWDRRVRALTRAMTAALGSGVSVTAAWARYVTSTDRSAWSDPTSRNLIGVLVALAASFFVVTWKLSAARYYQRAEAVRGRAVRPRGTESLRASAWPRAALAVVGAAAIAAFGVNTDVDLRVPALGERVGLAYTEWQLAAMSRSGTITRYRFAPAAPDVGVLRLDGRGHYSAEFCGGEWGAARVRGSRLRLVRVAQLAPGCSGDTMDLYESVIARPLRWTIDDGRLTLTNARGTLVYRPRATIYPHKTARTLLAGERDGWQYRVATEPERSPGESMWGWFEYRRSPGHSWHFDGLYPDEPIVVRYVPGVAVIAGFAPAGSAFVEYADGPARPRVRLPLMRGAARKGRIPFAAEVSGPTSPRGTLRALDAYGATVMTCTAQQPRKEGTHFVCPGSQLRSGRRAVPPVRQG